MTDPFGRTRLPLAVGSLESRIDALLEALQAWRAGEALDAATATWLAAGFGEFLFHGAELDAALGLRARRGSHRTPQRLIGDERQVKKFSAGSDA